MCELIERGNWEESLFKNDSKFFQTHGEKELLADVVQGHVNN